MARLTRNSYKRKIILFAVFVFISIALISTGFAAWVMSTNATENTTGNVDVGLVVDASLDITLDDVDYINSFKFQFEPAKDDLSGRFHLEYGDNPPTENLVLEFTGTVSNPAVLKELSIEMILPAGMQKAIDLKYISAPDCVKDKVALVVDTETGEFSCKLEFKWGEFFNNTNPSVYYDEDPKGKTISSFEALKHIQNIRACVYNYYDELDAAGSGLESETEILAAREAVIKEHPGTTLPKFTIILTAIAK